MNIELLGFLGAGIIAISLTPQVIKSWRTRSTEDISLIWNTIYLIGLITFVAYGFGIKSRPIIVFTTIEAILCFSLLVIKLRYK